MTDDEPTTQPEPAEDAAPRYAQICLDLKPINDVRAQLLRVHAELRPLDPYGATNANNNAKVQALQLDLSHVDTLCELSDMLEGLVAAMRGKDPQIEPSDPFIAPEAGEQEDEAEPDSQTEAAV